MPTFSTTAPAPVTPETAPNWRAAVLSCVVPGLGQASRGLPAKGLLVAAITAALVAVTVVMGRTGGVSAAMFFGMLIVLPWWTVQIYDARLAGDVSHATRWTFIASGRSLAQTFRTIWQRAHDVRYLGGLFLLTAVTDFYIIVANPEYALTVFCQKPVGLLGVLAKAQSPTLHILIGYGFLRLRRWSLFLYLAYAAFGLVNATVNYACFGYGRVRTVFLLSLLAFTAYVIWRRDRFLPHPAAPASL